MCFYEKSCAHIHDVIYWLHLSRSIPNVSFQLTPCRETFLCTTGNRVVAHAQMFWTLNIWMIKKLKIPIRYEDINKIQAEFS